MDRQKIVRKVKDVIFHHLRVDPKEMSDDQTLGSLGANSLDLIEMMVDIEQKFKKFKLELPQKMIQLNTKVGRVIAYIESKVI